MRMFENEPWPSRRKSSELQGRHPCRAELNQPKKTWPSVLWLVSEILPEAVSGSFKVLGVEITSAYHAGVVVRAMLPPNSPAAPPALLLLRNPKFCVTVKPGFGALRLRRPSQPRSVSNACDRSV